METINSTLKGVYFQIHELKEYKEYGGYDFYYVTIYKRSEQLHDKLIEGAETNIFYSMEDILDAIMIYEIRMLKAEREEVSK